MKTNQHTTYLHLIAWRHELVVDWWVSFLRLGTHRGRHHSPAWFRDRESNKKTGSEQQIENQSSLLDGGKLKRRIAAANSFYLILLPPNKEYSKDYSVAIGIRAQQQQQRQRNKASQVVAVSSSRRWPLFLSRRRSFCGTKQRHLSLSFKMYRQMDCYIFPCVWKQFYIFLTFDQARSQRMLTPDHLFVFAFRRIIHRGRTICRSSPNLT